MLPCAAVAEAATRKPDQSYDLVQLLLPQEKDLQADVLAA
jgi:hypothetical protein